MTLRTFMLYIKIALFLGFLLSSLSSFAQNLIIQAGKVIPVEGAEQEDVWIWIKEGRIQKIGKDFEIPWDAQVIDAKNKVVFPGMVEAVTSSGLDFPNENLPFVPFLSVRESLNPTATYFEDLLRHGITTVQVLPGTKTIIGGFGVILKLKGNTLESMLYREPGMLRISLASDENTSRLQKMAVLRQSLQEAQAYRERLKEESQSQTQSSPLQATVSGSVSLYLNAEDPTKQALLDLLEGRLQALIYCPEPSDCYRALQLAEEFKIKPVLQVGSRTPLALPFLEKANTPLLLDAPITYWETFDEERPPEERVVPLPFAQKKMTYALSSQGEHFLAYQAGLAVRHGLSREEAFKAITLYPARILGAEKDIGSLKEGKSADFLLLSGDPLDVRTWVEEVWIDGQAVYQRKNDVRLKHFWPSEK
jgi:hypothetical protein